LEHSPVGDQTSSPVARHLKIKKIINNTGKTTSSSGVDELLINNKITMDPSEIINLVKLFKSNPQVLMIFIPQSLKM